MTPLELRVTLPLSDRDRDDGAPLGAGRVHIDEHDRRVGVRGLFRAGEFLKGTAQRNEDGSIGAKARQVLNLRCIVVDDCDLIAQRKACEVGSAVKRASIIRPGRAKEARSIFDDVRTVRFTASGDERPDAQHECGMADECSHDWKLSRRCEPRDWPKPVFQGARSVATG